MQVSYPGKNHDGNATAPVQALRQFVRKREPSSMAVEHCELCSEIIPADHSHVLDLSTHALICTCQACSLLFGNEGVGSGKYRLIPRTYLSLPDFHMTDEQWDELMIPVNMVYLFRSSGEKRVVAFYPSPAGATESLLSLASWEELVSNNPILNTLEPDVEALLINRVQDVREYYIVPIDACYQLVGLLRISWKGLGGGEEARRAISEFFEDLRTKARIVNGDVR